MSIKIEKKIVSYALASKEEDSKAVTTTAEAKPAEQIVHMHEQVKRPGRLHLQDQDPAVRARPVRDHQRHGAERRHLA